MKIINWRWRTFLHDPWPPVRFTPHMKWVPGCSSLIIGPYEFIWRSQ